MISEHSAHWTPLSVDFSTWLWRYTYLLLISMLWHRQAIFKSKGDKMCSSAECRIWTLGPRHQIASRPNAHWQTDWAIEDQAKTWTRQPVPMISEHSAHLTPLSVAFRTWLWWYIYLLLLISMLWHRQAIFKSKGDKLCSSDECRIWSRDPRHQIASRLNAHWQTDWAIKDQAKTWTRQPVSVISEHSAHKNASKCTQRRRKKCTQNTYAQLMHHYNNVTLMCRYLKSCTTRLFSRQLFHGSWRPLLVLCMWSTVYRWIPLTMASNVRSVSMWWFHYHKLALSGSNME